MNRPATVLIGADVRLYSDGIALMLEREPGFEVVGTATSMNDVLARLTELEPDIVLLDSVMPDSVSSVHAIRQLAPEVKVVTLGVCELDDDIIRCAEAGVVGYVTRDGSASDLIATLCAAARGEVQCSPRVAGALMQRVARLTAERPPGIGRHSLTPRQQQVLRLIDHGLSNKEIAAQLCIEVPTVKSHVHTILQKLGTQRRGEAAALLRGVRPRSLHPTI